MAVDEGLRAEKRLRRGSDSEPQEVSALDNIVMSAYGYNDYDTFATGLRVMAQGPPRPGGCHIRASGNRSCAGSAT